MHKTLDAEGQEWGLNLTTHAFAELEESQRQEGGVYGHGLDCLVDMYVTRDWHQHCLLQRAHSRRVITWFHGKGTQRLKTLLPYLSLGIRSYLP